MFGVSEGTWLAWQRNGRVKCGQRHQRPVDGHTCVLYPLPELERLRAELGQIGQPYPDPDHPGAWRLPLNGFSVKREALIDEADLPIVRGRKLCWAARSDRKGGVVIVYVQGRQKHLHRLIAGAMGMTGRAARIGFSNRDPLDCRRANLLVRTQAQVTYAARPPKMREGKARTSRFKGVGFDSKCGKWHACITRGMLQASIGYFDDEILAAEAFDDCARLWYGEHAWLNFPDRPLTEAHRARAQAVLDKAAQRQRQRKRRVRKLARLLEREARDARDAMTAARQPLPLVAAPHDVPTVDRQVARKLLGVPRATWLRWERRGWLACGQDKGGRPVYQFAWVKRLLEACGRLRPPYPDPVRANVWRVPLTRREGRGKQALIDASSLPLIEGGWCGWGGVRDESSTERPDDAYVYFWSPSTRQYHPLRRLVAGVAGNRLQVCHRNRDPLDCRRQNLIVLTQRERSHRNRKIKSILGKPTSSHFKGVSWKKNAGKWVAMIRAGGKPKYLGLFEWEVSAALAYDRAARELFGPHAYFNFPQELRAEHDRKAA